MKQTCNLKDTDLEDSMKICKNLPLKIYLFFKLNYSRAPKAKLNLHTFSIAGPHSLICCKPEKMGIKLVNVYQFEMLVMPTSIASLFPILCSMNEEGIWVDLVSINTEDNNCGKEGKNYKKETEKEL